MARNPAVARNPVRGGSLLTGASAQGPGHFTLSNVGGKHNMPWFLCSLCPGRCHGPDVAEVYPLPSRMAAASTCGGNGAEPRVRRAFRPGIRETEPPGATQHSEYQAPGPSITAVHFQLVPSPKHLWTCDRSGSL